MLSRRFFLHRVPLVALSLVLPLCAVGCNGKSRRLSERETLAYKDKLHRDHQQELSADKWQQLYYHPGRTRSEIDGFFEKLRAQHAQQLKFDSLRLEHGRRSSTAKSQAGALPSAASQKAGSGGANSK